MAEQPIEITPSQLSRMQANAVLRERRRIVAFLRNHAEALEGLERHQAAHELSLITDVIEEGNAVLTQVTALPTAEELNDDATPEGAGGMSDDEIAPVRERDDEEDMRALLGTRGITPAALPRD